MKLKRYADHYTWSHPMTHGALAHQDGAVSRMIEWDGIDVDLTTEQERAVRWERFYTALNALEVGYCAEFHWWREWDDSLAARYRAQGQHIVRGGAFAQSIRDAQADHLARFGMSNSVAVVLTKIPRQGFLTFAGKGLFAPKATLARQQKDAQALDSQAERLLPVLPGARFVDAEGFIKRIQQSYDRSRFVRGVPAAVRDGDLLSESLLAAAPRDVSGDGSPLGYVDLEGYTSKVLYVYHYPDATPGWFAGLASLSVPMHVVQIVIPINTRTAMRKSENESRLADGTMSDRGAEKQRAQLREMTAYRQFVADNNLGVFYNAYIIHIHGTPDELNQNSRIVKDWIEARGGQVRDNDYVQLPYFRVAQPGQGYRVPKVRDDHLLQVANMLPVQVYRDGDGHEPESLRLGESGQLVGFNLSRQKVAHAVTIAMTGSGKGVDKVATIAETFPFGIDWYIAEIGQSYRWIVEAFGGTYSRLDPTESVINPLPPFNVANTKDVLPLDAVVAGQTINALAFLLTDGRTTLSVHEAKAGQDALQYLYAAPDAKRYAPSLPEYLAALRTDLFDNELQTAAAKTMADNLESFLGTTEGRIFTRDDNLVLSQGITGVDLKDIDRANPKLLKFYLVFIALKFSHLAFARRAPARVLLDEMHKFVAIAPDVIGRLISELARMGRKDDAAIDIVTQGLKEVDVVETEVLNSMRLRSLLYRPDEHDAIASRIAMPDGALQVWKSWPDPTEATWRPAIRSIGSDYYNLHLSFPDLLLDFASTTPRDLTLKDEIARITRDPMERWRLLRERRRS
jgi:hypothetical protein